MSMMNETSEITSRLKAVRRGIRRVQLLRGALFVGLVVLEAVLKSLYARFLAVLRFSNIRKTWDAKLSKQSH